MEENNINRKDWPLFLLLCGGVLLRLAICWINPPENVFDDHLEPIQLLLTTGRIPAPNDCWQCYQPPAFYLFSAVAAKIALALALPLGGLTKFLQLLTALFSVLNLGILLLIVRRLPFSGWCRILVFGMFCFLPRDVYMAGIHSNDAATYCAISLCVYLAMRVLAGEWRPWLLYTLGLASVVAVLTKYTAFVVIPVIWFVIGWRYLDAKMERRKMMRAGIIALLLPVVVLGGYLLHNQNSYGKALPFNDQLFDAADKYARDGATTDFVSFTPWKFVRTPLLVPGQISSFWTVAYTGTWFDTEPRYVTFLGGDLNWWQAYQGWLKGEGRFPAGPVALPGPVKAVGGALEAAGLIPLGLGMIGFGAGLKSLFAPRGAARGDATHAGLFSLLAITTIAGIFYLAWKKPVFTAMKASYFLGALPAFGYFVGRGFMLLQDRATPRLLLTMAMLLLLVLSVVHLLQIITLFTLPLV